MSIDAPTGTAIGTTLAAIFAGAWGYIQQQKAKTEADKAKSVESVSREDLAKSAVDLAESYRASASEWKERWEIEHKEFGEYRKTQHAKASEYQASLLRLTEENAKLSAKTDLAPLIEHMDRQSRTNEAVSVALADLSNAQADLSKAVGMLLHELEQRNPQKIKKTEP